MTALLQRAAKGDAEASDLVLRQHFAELHLLAEHYMRGQRPGTTLQATALVTSAYLRLFSTKEKEFTSRLHFIAAFGLAMKCVLIEHARRNGRMKRKHTRVDQELGALHDAFKRSHFDVLALDEAIADYRQKNPAMCAALEAMLFSGLNRQEAAELAGIPLRTFERKWPALQAWFRRRLA
ncbi:MAG: RNA polymerase subunit sigma [Planctomycetes bacterium]|nr:RNA polymerase subunit sigma [Planctomycetota bacterium]